MLSQSQKRKISKKQCTYLETMEKCTHEQARVIEQALKIQENLHTLVVQRVGELENGIHAFMFKAWWA